MEIGFVALVVSFGMGVVLGLFVKYCSGKDQNNVGK